MQHAKQAAPLCQHIKRAATKGCARIDPELASDRITDAVETLPESSVSGAPGRETRLDAPETSHDRKDSSRLVS